MKILFVCVHNAGRSQMAEAFVNYYAKSYSLPVTAKSAGTVSGKSLNPVAVQAMDQVGISMANQLPKLITKEMVDEADLIITMGCGVDAESCPAKFVASVDWGLDDPAGQGIEAVRVVREQIDLRVREMLSLD